MIVIHSPLWQYLSPPSLPPYPPLLPSPPFVQQSAVWYPLPQWSPLAASPFCSPFPLHPTVSSHLSCLSLPNAEKDVCYSSLNICGVVMGKINGPKLYSPAWRGGASGWSCYWIPTNACLCSSELIQFLFDSIVGKLWVFICKNEMHLIAVITRVGFRVQVGSLVPLK